MTIPNSLLTISKSMGIMNKLASLLPYHVLLKLYFSLVHRHLVCCVTAWGFSGLANIRRLQAVQSRAVSLLPCVPNCEKYVWNKLFRFSHIFRNFPIVKLFHTVMLDEHRLVDSKISSVLAEHRHCARFKPSNNLHFPLLTKIKSRQSFICCYIKFCNTLPRDLKACISLGQCINKPKFCFLFRCTIWPWWIVFYHIYCTIVEIILTISFVNLTRCFS